MSINGIWAAIVDTLQPDKFFADLPQICAEARDKFAFLVAFMILVTGLVIHLRGARSDFSELLPPVAKAFVIVGIAANIAFFLGLIDSGVAEIAKMTGYDTNKIVKKMEGLVDAVSGKNVQGSAGIVPASQNPGDKNSKSFQWWNPFSWNDSLQAAGDNFIQAVQNAVKWILNAVAVIVVRLAELVILLLSLLRYFAVHAGSIFLPIFLAMLMLPTASGTGRQFILGMIGVICWPIGWALANLGTYSALEAAERALSALSGGPVLMSFLGYLFIASVVILLGFVLIAIYSAAPMAISKMVEHGSNAALSIGGVGQATAMRTAPGLAMSGAQAAAGITMGAARMATGMFPGASAAGRAFGGVVQSVVPEGVRKGAAQLAGGIGEAAGMITGVGQQALETSASAAGQIGAESGVGASVTFHGTPASRAASRVLGRGRRR